MSSVISHARALLLGQEIELRRLGQVQVLSREPLAIEIDHGSTAVLFRFGVVVLFDVAPPVEASLLERLQPLIKAPFQKPQTEDIEIHVQEGAGEEVDAEGIRLPDMALPRLQVVADILAKSLVLDHYESGIAATLDRVEPLAERMHAYGRLPRQAHELMTHIGGILRIQHRMVARAQVGEKPDVLWDHPEVENLWKRLENEYDIDERQIALERKLDLVSSTSQMLLGLLQDARTLRVEWYIVILIVVEIVLTLYQLVFRHT